MSADISPTALFNELDRRVIGQVAAKKALCVAFKNRERRQKLNKMAQMFVTNKNVLLIGPTGVGKTELIRQITHLTDSPIVTTVATNYTEKGYVGGDVDTMINDLVKATRVMIKQRESQSKPTSEQVEAFWKKIIPFIINEGPKVSKNKEVSAAIEKKDEKKLLDWCMNDKNFNFFKNITIDNPWAGDEKVSEEKPDISTDPDAWLDWFMSVRGHSKKKKRLKIKELHEKYFPKSSFSMTDAQLVSYIENNGVVFIDEFDKLGAADDTRNSQLKQAVQFELLTMFEGKDVSTDIGNINTRNILFICGGAFERVKLSEITPELMGRLPIKVKLDPLSQEDFVKILIEKEYNVIEQYKLLLESSGIKLSFTDEAIQRVAEIAFNANKDIVNLGARRLDEVIEKCLGEILFNTEDDVNEIRIDEEYVNTHGTIKRL